jgi:hypothetical protein
VHEDLVQGIPGLAGAVQIAEDQGLQLILGGKEMRADMAVSLGKADESGDFVGLKEFSNSGDDFLDHRRLWRLIFSKKMYRKRRLKPARKKYDLHQVPSLSCLPGRHGLAQGRGPKFFQSLNKVLYFRTKFRRFG